KAIGLLSVLVLAGVWGCPQLIVTTPDGARFWRRLIMKGGTTGVAAFTQPTTVVFGPDGRLYIAQLNGVILAVTLDSGKRLVEIEEIRTLEGRALIGLAFDPTGSADEMGLYVADNLGPINVVVPDFTGKITRLSGPGFSVAEDVIVGLPRSTADHLTNSLAFGPDQRLYIAQSGMTNNGMPFPAVFGNREESPLSAALLVADVLAPGFSGIEDVQTFCTGLRNMYDFVFHTNGNIYGVEQGENAGFGGPPSSDVPPCEEMGPDPGNQMDQLELLVEGGYYGHPNPSRGECAYESDIPGGAAFIPPLTYFPLREVATGGVEYVASTFGGVMEGDLLVTYFGQSNSVVRVVLSEDGQAVESLEVLAEGFYNPL
ncbi:MAG: hypothetical protein GTO22_21055, partial [Gemmatimonadales bacterium]|nr:hypothetical protein [Gemmatimonadales bacterium]